MVISWITSVSTTDRKRVFLGTAQKSPYYDKVPWSVRRIKVSCHAAHRYGKQEGFLRILITISILQFIGQIMGETVKLIMDKKLELNQKR